MKNKMIILALTSMLMVGCSVQNQDAKKEHEQTTQKVEKNNQEESKENKLNIDDIKSEELDTDFVKNKTGDVEAKRIFRKNINEVIEHNGFKFTFKKVDISHYKPLTDRAVDELNSIENLSLVKNNVYISIRMTVEIENNNDKIYNLANYDTFLTTNLKEQSKAFNYFSENDLKFLPNTKKTLVYQFFLPNTNIEDIDKITELTILTPRRYDEHGNGYEKDEGTTLKIKIK